jgi:hypothetical protein
VWSRSCTGPPLLLLTRKRSQESTPQHQPASQPGVSRQRQSPEREREEGRKAVGRVAVAQKGVQTPPPGSLRTCFTWRSWHLHLHLLEEKQAAASARPTQKLPPPTRKLRRVSWKVAGDVAVPGRENSVGSPEESDGNGLLD